MKLPWGKKQPEEALKQQLRDQARAVSNGNDETGKEEQTAPEQEKHTPEQAPSPLRPEPVKPPDPEPESTPIQPPEPAIKSQGSGAMYSGTDLTLHFGMKGRAIGLKGRPQPRPSIKGLDYLGHELTLHIDKNNRQTDLSKLQVSHLPWYKELFFLLISALKWIFTIKPKLLIIERYMWGETFGYFLLGAMGFTFFMIITSIFSLGEKIFQKNIPPFTIAKVLLLSAPAFLVLAIPVAVVFSTLMAMGRLNRDNEIVAFTTCGISLYRILVPFISLAITAGLMTWFIYEYVVPQNNREYKRVLKVFWEAQVVDFIKPGIVIKAPDRKYFYVESINKTEGIMYNIRLYDYYKTDDTMRKFPRIFVAREGWVEDGFLVLQDVTLYNLDQTRGDSLVSASMPKIQIDIRPQSVDYLLEPHPTELQAMQLRERIMRRRDKIRSMPFFNPGEIAAYLRDHTEYYLKYSIPVACLALVLVAVPVSLRGPRDERNMGIILTFVLVMCYYMVFFTCRTLGARGIMLTDPVSVFGQQVFGKGDNLAHPMIAGWFTPVLFFMVGAFLLWRARK